MEIHMMSIETSLSERKQTHVEDGTCAEHTCRTKKTEKSYSSSIGSSKVCFLTVQGTRRSGSISKIITGHNSLVAVAQLPLDCWHYPSGVGRTSWDQSECVCVPNVRAHNVQMPQVHKRSLTGEHSSHPSCCCASSGNTARTMPPRDRSYAKAAEILWRLCC